MSWNVRVIVKVLVSTFMLLTFFNGCKDVSWDPPMPEYQDTSYYPLAVGNWWEWVALPSENSRYRKTQHVLKKSVVNSEEYFTIVDSVFDGNTFQQSRMSIVIRNGSIVRDTLKYWQIDFNSTRTDSIESHGYVSKIIDTLTTPAGHFKNIAYIHYPAVNKDYMYQDYFVKGVGLVQRLSEVVYVHLNRAYVNNTKYGF